MRVHVKFEDKCVVIPCKDGRESIKWLISEAVRRFKGLNGGSESSQLNVMSSCLCMPNQGGMLYFSDAIGDVLDNDGFAELKREIMISLVDFFHCQTNGLNYKQALLYVYLQMSILATSQVKKYSAKHNPKISILKPKI